MRQLRNCVGHLNKGICKSGFVVWPFMGRTINLKEVVQMCLSRGT